jgi:hypothetical protein
MRLMFKSMLLTMAALAVSGATAAVASAETHEWLLNGSPVKASTPVNRSATEFKGRSFFTGGGEETLKCALSGKGTVNEKGAGTVTEWKLTSCTTQNSPFTCEEGTTFTAAALGLPWKTKIFAAEGLGAEVLDEVRPETEGSGHQVGFTWQCKTKTIFGSKLYKVSCSAGSQSNRLTNEGSGLVGERWGAIPSPTMVCERSFGEEKLAGSEAIFPSNTTIKAQSGTLSFK